MPQAPHLIYQDLTQPVIPLAETVMESKWHFPWSEPVRFRIDPKRKIAIDSWLYRIAPIDVFTEQVFEDKWHYAWSLPVRFRRIHTSRIVSGLVWNPQQPLPPVGPWYVPLSEPVRFKKGLRAHYHQYEFPDVEFIPHVDTFFAAWNPWFTEPVRFLRGMRTPYPPDFFYHPRLLPTPNVFLTMDALEDQDSALFGIDSGAPSPTIPSQEGALVVITEIEAESGVGISIGD